MIIKCQVVLLHNCQKHASTTFQDFRPIRANIVASFFTVSKYSLWAQMGSFYRMHLGKYSTAI